MRVQRAKEEVQGVKKRGEGEREKRMREKGKIQVPHQTTVQKVMPQLFHHCFCVCG